MHNNKTIKALILSFLLVFSSVTLAADATPTDEDTGHTPNHNLSVKGIYVTQYNAENTSFLNYLIKHSKASGINTMVIDMELPSKRLRDNVAMIKENGIHYVARVVMFDGGATADQISNPDYWQKRYALVQQAINYGATSIQLDYIRYNSKQPPSAENAKNVLKIISWYKDKLAAQNISLQVDVFGIAAFGESKSIGQNIKLFSGSVDAICPMVYPSHFTPFAQHFKTPYDTIYDALASAQDQFEGKMPTKLIPYIELSNYHFSMNRPQTLAYIKEQIRAVEDVGADGWYAWSPHNRYDNLFSILEGQTVTQN